MSVSNECVRRCTRCLSQQRVSPAHFGCDIAVSQEHLAQRGSHLFACAWERVESQHGTLGFKTTPVGRTIQADDSGAHQSLHAVSHPGRTIRFVSTGLRLARS
eukprot:599940-Rhodomonas_salina.5